MPVDLKGISFNLKPLVFSGGVYFFRNLHVVDTEDLFAVNADGMVVFGIAYKLKPGLCFVLQVNLAHQPFFGEHSQVTINRVAGHVGLVFSDFFKDFLR